MSKFSETLNDLRYRFRHTVPSKSARQLIVIALIVFSIPAGVMLSQNIQRFRTGAALETAQIYFSPATQSLPPDSNFKVMVDSKTNQVGFVRVQYTFNPSLVQLTSEVTTAPIFSTVVSKTTMSQANASGQVVFVIALSPSDRANPPSGVFEVANFNVKAVSTTQNASASLTFTDAEIQLVDLASQVIPFTTGGSLLTLNPVTATSTSAPTATTTSAPTATSTTVPSATSTATPTATTAPSATSTIAPTSTSAPTATNTVAPSATATSAPTATNTTAPKIGDVNNDGIVNIADVGIIIDVYGTSPAGDARADLNKDGRVNIIDIGIVIDHYGL